MWSRCARAAPREQVIILSYVNHIFLKNLNVFERERENNLEQNRFPPAEMARDDFDTLRDGPR
jgi:hypothetical protein